MGNWNSFSRFLGLATLKLISTCNLLIASVWQRWGGTHQTVRTTTGEAGRKRRRGQGMTFNLFALALMCTLVEWLVSWPSDLAVWVRSQVQAGNIFAPSCEAKKRQHLGVRTNQKHSVAGCCNTIRYCKCKCRSVNSSRPKRKTHGKGHIATIICLHH